MNPAVFTYRTATIAPDMMGDIIEASKMLPIALQARVNKRQLPHDKVVSIQAWLLLKAYLVEHGLNHEQLLSNVQFSPFDKPSFSQQKPQIHFNFSHSYEKVICAISTISPIGVDVEKIMPFDAEALAVYFTTAELDFIVQSPNQKVGFYSLWTKKEAFLKCRGDGIATAALASIDVLQSSIIDNRVRYTFYPINVGADYQSYVCVSGI